MTRQRILTRILGEDTVRALGGSEGEWLISTKNLVKVLWPVAFAALIAWGVSIDPPHKPNHVSWEYSPTWAAIPLLALIPIYLVAVVSALQHAPQMVRLSILLGAILGSTYTLANVKRPPFALLDQKVASLQLR